MRVLFALVLVACGSHHDRDQNGGDDTVEPDASTDANDVIDAADAPIDAPVPQQSAGKCTQIDQPGWLSCPTGMSCQCYFHYYKTFVDKPASLALWVTETSVEVVSGMLPQNKVLTSPPHAIIPLMTNAMTGVKTGMYFPYSVTISAAGVLELKLRDTDGYIPEKFVKQTDSDCGNRGQILECTFN